MTFNSQPLVKRFTFRIMPIIGIILVLFFSEGLLAQTPQKKLRVFDRFGNEAKPETLPSTKSMNSSATVQAGYFQLMFEDVSLGLNAGFNDAVTGADRRAVAVQVFTDISQMISPANDPYTGASNQNQPLVRLKISAWSWMSPPPPSNALGVSSTYYTVVSPRDTGMIDGMVWHAINTGYDPYTDLNLVAAYSATTYHGYMAINLDNYPFFTDLTQTTPASDYDLYSIMLHEATHLLGFNSLISATGASTINGSAFYSRYDYFLHYSNGTPVVNITNGCYSTVFNGPATNLTPPAGCANEIKFTGTMTHPVYCPSTFAPGSSLSHFDDQCPPNVNYVMTYSNGTGPTYMKRKYTIQEASVLCDMGYQMTGTYGTPFLVQYPTQPNLSYDNTYGACGSRIAGTNDLFYYSNPTQFYSATVNQPLVMNDFLNNDANADHYICLELNGGGGVLSNLTPTSFTFTPDTTRAGFQAVIQYIPVDASGKMGNLTYIWITVVAQPLPSCPSNSCNMVCNGDFENIHQIYCSPLTNMTISEGANSVDLFRGNVALTYFNSSTVSFMCGSATVPYPHTGGGQQYIGIAGGPAPHSINNTEAIYFPLNSTMQAGKTYRVSFWAMDYTSSCPGGLNFVASAQPPCPMPYQTNEPPTTTTCGYTYTPYLMCNYPISNVTSWTRFSFYYTPPVNCSYMMIYAYGGTTWSYIYLDDVEMFEKPMSVNAGADTLICYGGTATLSAVMPCTGDVLKYSWSTNAGPAGNTASISVSPLVNTTYTLTINDSTSGIGGVDSVKVMLHACTTGITEKDAAGGLKVWPNPTAGLLNLELSQGIAGKETFIEVEDMLGQVLYSKTTREISLALDLSSLPPGMYFLSARCEGNIWKRKFQVK